MSKPIASRERRLTENEVFFRQYNERVEKGLQEVEDLATSQGQREMLYSIDFPIQFYCECSNEKCDKRIHLLPIVYRDLHQNSNQFVVLPGHVVPEFERIIRAEPDYMIVEKYKSAPPKASKLNPTNLSTQ